MSKTTPQKKLWIIAYDISNDKTRLKIATLLETYGVRCNYSLFECLITEAQKTKIQNKISKLVKAPTDSILFYYLCNSCLQKREAIGYYPELMDDVVMV